MRGVADKQKEKAEEMMRKNIPPCANIVLPPMSASTCRTHAPALLTFPLPSEGAYHLKSELAKFHH